MSNASAEKTQQQAPQQPRGSTALTVIRTELGMMMPEIQNALPAHITKERFGRVVLTAIQNNPELLEVDRRSVWKACMQAATDGLYPDGKQGAIVVRWSPKGKQAAWQPMIEGVRIKAQNAGQISTWDVSAVYANDAFEYEKGDDPFIRHRPALTNRGDLIAAYSIATLKDGTKSREVMGVDEIYEIRDQFSTAWQAFVAKKIKSTPWASAPGEMAKKTVGHRHAKVLPLSSDIRELLIKGDGLRTGSEPALLTDGTAPKGRLSLASKFDMLAGGDDPTPETTDTIEHDPQTGEIIEGKVNEASDDRKSETASKDTGQGAGAAQTSQASPATAAKADAAKGKAEVKENPLKTFTQDGDAVAAKGMGALKDWLEDLDGDRMALLTPAHQTRWEAIAMKADGNR